MTFLSQIKNNSVKFITDNSVISAAAVGYGATHAYSVLNPVGGAILFATFVQNGGLKTKTYYLPNYSKPIISSNLNFILTKIKACVMAWSAAYYITPYANLATVAKGFSATMSVPGKLGALISTVASKAFASLLAMPSQMYTTTAFAVNSINLPAVAATVAVVVLVVSLYKFWNYLEKKGDEGRRAIYDPMKADIASLKADITAEISKI